MSPIVFLDIDGVLVTHGSIAKRAHGVSGVDPDCVSALNRILRETGAKIVISSTWRMIHSADRMADLLMLWGVEGEIVGATPDLTVYERPPIYAPTMRGNEIQQWLNLNQHGAFVILDDDDDMVHLSPYLVKTTFERGLTLEDAETAIAVLQQQVGKELTGQ